MNPFKSYGRGIAELLYIVRDSAGDAVRYLKHGVVGLLVLLLSIALLFVTPLLALRIVYLDYRNR